MWDWDIWDFSNLDRIKRFIMIEGLDRGENKNMKVKKDDYGSCCSIKDC